MGRRDATILFALGALSLLGSCGAPWNGPAAYDSAGTTDAQSATSRPNVVLVVIDTLRADKVGAYDADLPDDVTPNLDAMAERGLLFSRALSSSSWTRPSIGSLLTSRYPRTLGLHREQGDSLPPRFELLSETLHDAGWFTVGLTANPNINSVFGFSDGFDRYVDSHVVWDWMNPGPGEQQWWQAPVPDARALFDRGWQLIEERGASPFFLMVTIMEVHEHGEREPPAEYAELYDDRMDQRYLQRVRQADAETGRFLDRLTSSPDPRLRDTLVVVLSDHGEGLTDHPGVEQSEGHGLTLYGSQVRVPLLLEHLDGRLPAGRRVKTPVSLLDVAPTILDFAGLEPLADAEGRSLLPLLDQPAADLDWPERFVVESRFRDTESLGVYGPAWSWLEHRRPLGGQAPEELIPYPGPEVGRISDRSEVDPGRAQGMRAWLAAWEESHPSAEAERVDGSAPETEQLRSLGYIE